VTADTERQGLRKQPSRVQRLREWWKSRARLEEVRMPKWEYLHVHLRLRGTQPSRTTIRGQKVEGPEEVDRAINDLGSEGWELVAVVPFAGEGDTEGHTLYFKRRIS